MVAAVEGGAWDHLKAEEAAVEEPREAATELMERGALKVGAEECGGREADGRRGQVQARVLRLSRVRRSLIKMFEYKNKLLTF